jgi:hypothetical protein
MMNSSNVQEVTRTRETSWLSFTRHLAEMVVAMVMGMVALAPLWIAVFTLFGCSSLLKHADVHAMAMATDMAIGMALWMRYRGHGRQSILEMVGAMYLPFFVLFGPYWVGLITAGALLTFGHILMVPTMVGVMLRRRAEYSHRGHHRTGLPQVARKRW